MIQSWSRRLLNSVLPLLLMASAFAVPFAVTHVARSQPAGIETPITDIAADRLVGYWDLRDRDTYFQVTNTSSGPVTIHIQIYNAGNSCAEFDYFDTLTPRDTHIYNVASLDRNNGAPLAAPDLTGGNGIIGVSVSPQGDNDNVLTGNFRIIDNAGYEYRTNMAGEGHNGYSGIQKINFNNVDGSTLADLVVITYYEDNDTIYPTLSIWDPVIYDQNENPISCPPVLTGCFSNIDELFFFDTFGFTNNRLNVGINQAVTNSKGAPSLCLGTDTVGHLELYREFIDAPFEQGDEGAIFIGLNNGSSTGSMDHAVADGEPVL